MTPDVFVLQPIGVIHTPFTERYLAPRQPGTGALGAEGRIELYPGSNFEAAVEDLQGFDFIWVITWFHRNAHWRPKVLPPRGGRTRRSVFATRSPHRPNPLGLSLLRLLSVRGRVLRVGDVDLLDETPVMDIKPYITSVEARPEARMGWLDALERAGDPEASGYSVRYEEIALLQRDFLRVVHDIDLDPVALPALTRDPHPHPYRRIQRRGDGLHQLALRSWRVRYTLEGSVVVIDHIASGYALEALSGTGILDEPAHRDFHARWPGIAPRLADVVRQSLTVAQ